jgi:hypothetical protein
MCSIPLYRRRGDVWSRRFYEHKGINQEVLKVNEPNMADAINICILDVSM